MAGPRDVDPLLLIGGLLMSAGALLNMAGMQLAFAAVPQTPLTMLLVELAGKFIAYAGLAGALAGAVVMALGFEEVLAGREETKVALLLAMVVLSAPSGGGYAVGSALVLLSSSLRIARLLKGARA
ncbi:MAG: hypothetical protein ABWK00_05350 [Desulfurococcaceae archaeon]